MMGLGVLARLSIFCYPPQRREDDVTILDQFGRTRSKVRETYVTVC